VYCPVRTWRINGYGADAAAETAIVCERIFLRQIRMTARIILAGAVLAVGFVGNAGSPLGHGEPLQIRARARIMLAAGSRESGETYPGAILLGPTLAQCKLSVYTMRKGC
jgi:hypothetical protein